MPRIALTIVVPLLLSGCFASPLVIGDASQGVNNSTGSFTGLKTILDEALTAPSPRKIKIILVHGMADHCPGYGLDEKEGWLTSRVLQQTFQFSADPDTPAARLYEFRDPDNHFKVYLGLKSFLYSGTATPNHHVNIEVAEFTYSSLLHKLKSRQLGFDFTQYPDSTTPNDAVIDYQSPEDRDAAKEAAETCNAPVSRPATLFSQHRVWGNRVLKEEVMDRYLPDVVLYLGQYGQTLNDSFADALCRLTSERPRDPTSNKPAYSAEEKCLWGTDHNRPQDLQVVFMTHSLGGRLTYDTLLELVGCEVRTGANCDVPGKAEDPESIAAQKYVGTLTAQRLAIYMFANQIPLLGLAYVPVAVHDGAIHPFFARGIQTEDDSPGGLPQKHLCSGEGRFYCLSRLNRSFKGDPQDPRATGDGQFDFVAFSDPNDLLTYPVPPTYADQVSEDAVVRISNVYGKNSTWWLGIFENPLAAHVDYMTIGRTWDAVWFGAKCGKVLNSAVTCPDALKAN